MKTQHLASGLTGVEDLIGATLDHMRGLGYSAGYLGRCRAVWRDFLEFLRGLSAEGFCEETVVCYLESRGISADSCGSSSRKRFVRAAMRILAEFKLHGCYQRRRYTSQKVKLFDSFQTVLNTYDEFCRRQRGCTPGTMRCRIRHITRFLHFLESADIRDLGEICAKHLSDFVRSQAHLKPRTLAVIVSDLRSFMRFLCMEGIMLKNLSEHVPKVRVPRGARIPTAWSTHDVEAILAAVDRSSPRGKRDYAILMLACRIGLRVGDIRTLCLEKLRWHENRIELVQAKTGVPVTLPLTEDVGEALVDYLQHGRAATKHREVFLRVNAPIEPFASNDNLHHIITFYRQRARIGLERPGCKGMHSLRHSVATRLLEVDTPLETIAGVLGHLSLESTQIYTKVDVETLRSAALHVEVTNE
jgi:site-specific recombinase XerD